MSSYVQTPWYDEEKEPESLKGKVALVTGGSSGIGKAIARSLYKYGAHVVVTSRKVDRAQVAVDELKKEGDAPGSLEAMALDLSDLDEVREFAKAFQSNHTNLHFFVENAGLVLAGAKSGPWVGKQGYEMTHVSNYLGHFLLLNLFMPLMQKSAPARIVAESSIVHWAHNAADLDSLLPENQKKSVEHENDIGRFKAYADSKVNQVLMSFELQRRLKEKNIQGITITPVNPGAVATAIAAEERGVDRSWNPVRLTPDDGAKTAVHALLSARFEEKTGIFLQPYYTPPHLSQPLLNGWDMLLFELFGQKLTWGCYEWIPHPNAHDRDFAKKLWDASAKACGIETF